MTHVVRCSLSQRVVSADCTTGPADAKGGIAPRQSTAKAALSHSREGGHERAVVMDSGVMRSIVPLRQVDLPDDSNISAPIPHQSYPARVPGFPRRA